MFRKELADVLRQTAWFLAVVAVLPIPIILFKGATGPYRAVLAPLLEMGLIFWSLFLGASLLGREQGQRAVEYALTLPHSRLGLLVRMAGPRLIVMLGFLVAAGLVFRIGLLGDSDVLPLALVAGIGLQLFFISLSLSVLIENFIVLCLASLMAWYAAGSAVFVMLGRSGARPVGLYMSGLFAFPRLDAGAWGSASGPLLLLLIILPVVPFVAALLVSFGRFDVRRSRPFKRRYGIAFAAGLAFCALAAFGGRAAADSLAPRHFYLTQNLKLAEWRLGSNGMSIHGPGSSLGVRFGPLGSLFIADDGSSLFAWDADRQLNRIDLGTGTVEPFYRPESKRASLLDQRIYGSTIALIEIGSRRDELQLVALDLKTKKADRHVFTHAALRAGEPRIIATDIRDGMRFWICMILKGGFSTLRLWEDGRVEEVLVKGRLQTANSPRYLNGLLLFAGREPMIVLQDTGGSFELKKEFPAGELFQPQAEYFGYRLPLDAPPLSFAYGKRGRQLARMSLETLEIEDLGNWGEDDDAWGYVQRLGDQAYFIGGSRSRKNLDVYALSGAGMSLIRSFPGIDTERRDTRFTVDGSGIVITEGRRVGVYAFPDLREIAYQ